MSKNPHHGRLKATEGSCLAITGIQGPLTEDPLKKKKASAKRKMDFLVHSDWQINGCDDRCSPSSNSKRKS